MQHNQVKPYQKSDATKKEEVTSMFDRIAPFYDLLNGVLSAGIDTLWRRKAIKTVQTRNTDLAILDIATGTADLALEANKQLDAKEIIGLDISQKMIDIGNKKIQKKGLDNTIKLELGDSENLHYDTGYFDVVTAAFGVRNFGDLKKGLSEMHRVLKPGGEMIVLEFSRPTIFPFKQMFNLYFKYILPLIGRFTSKDPRAYSYLYESVQVFPDYDKFGEILKDIGFKQVKWRALSLGICTIYHSVK